MYMLSFKHLNFVIDSVRPVVTVKVMQELRQLPALAGSCRWEVGVDQDKEGRRAGG